MLPEITWLDAVSYLLSLVALVLAVIAFLLARSARQKTRAQIEHRQKIQDRLSRLENELTRRLPDQIGHNIDKQLSNPAWIGRLYERLEHERSKREPAPASQALSAGGPPFPDPQPPAPPVEPAFTPTRVQAIYEQWCLTGTPPKKETGIEIVPLRFATTRSASEIQTPIPLFEDAAQVAELVRFSRPGDSAALVYPHPDAAYSPTVNYLFPNLKETDYQGVNRELFARLQPVHLTRTDGRFWQQTTAP